MAENRCRRYDIVGYKAKLECYLIAGHRNASGGLVYRYPFWDTKGLAVCEAA